MEETGYRTFILEAKFNIFKLKKKIFGRAKENYIVFIFIICEISVTN